MSNSPFFVDDQMFHPIKLKKKLPLSYNWANFEDWSLTTNVTLDIKNKWIKQYLIREYKDYNLKCFPLIINLDGDYLTDDFKLTNLIELSKVRNICTIKIEFSTTDSEIVDKQKIRELTLKNII